MRTAFYPSEAFRTCSTSRLTLSDIAHSAMRVVITQPKTDVARLAHAITVLFFFASSLPATFSDNPSRKESESSRSFRSFSESMLLPVSVRLLRSCLSSPALPTADFKRSTRWSVKTSVTSFLGSLLLLLIKVPHALTTEERNESAMRALSDNNVVQDFLIDGFWCVMLIAFQTVEHGCSLGYCRADFVDEFMRQYFVGRRSTVSVCSYEPIRMTTKRAFVRAATTFQVVFERCICRRFCHAISSVVWLMGVLGNTPQSSHGGP